MNDLKDVFANIFTHRRWGRGIETASGSGSTVAYTAQLRADLLDLCRRLQVRSFLDLPCGDLNWMQHVDFEGAGIAYTGADIVPELIAQVREKFPRRQFLVTDLTADPLPSADLVFVRDCLVHLPLALITKALANIRQSGIKYLLTTTFLDACNRDIRTGEWRMINLTAPPFNLPEPELYLPDFYRHDQFTNKRLGLWQVSQLPQ